MSRIESGSALPTLSEVVAWTDAVDVPRETATRIKSLTGSAHLDASSWRTALNGKDHLQEDIRRRESTATRIRTYQHSVVPGLLQTAEYAECVFGMFQIAYDADALIAAVGARMERQLALYERSRRFDFLITEAALRWRPSSPEVQVAQLDRLVVLNARENVSIGIVAADREAVTTYSHGFVVYEDDEGEFVTLEMIHGPLTLRSDDEVRLYRDRWALLNRMALFGDDASAYLQELRRSVG